MRWIWLGLFGLSAGAAACAPREPPEVLAVRQRMESERTALSEELDGVEARLEEDAQRLRLYRILAERHRHVSALACQSAEGHLDSMDRLARHEREKRAARRRLARLETSPATQGTR